MKLELIIFDGSKEVAKLPFNGDLDTIRRIMAIVAEVIEADQRVMTVDKTD